MRIRNYTLNSSIQKKLQTLHSISQVKKMFCYQCQETLGNKGCTRNGVCGKKSETADLQDKLLYALKGFAFADKKARDLGLPDAADADAGPFIMKMLFSTLTNVNFDAGFFREAIAETIRRRDAVKEEIHKSGACSCCETSAKVPGPVLVTYDELMAMTDAELSGKIGVLSTQDPDIRSVRETLMYGLKGIGAYGFHAAVLGRSQKRIAPYLERALCAVMDDSVTLDEYVEMLLECGQMGVEVLSLLEEANTGAYGYPEPTKVSVRAGSRPGILISGHDLKDLEMLLEQTKGTGIDVYTHGEMLPAHAYPFFKKYDNLVANYGGSWQSQKQDFADFNGPILMTTNCLVPPAESYKDRIRTTGVVGFPGIPHIDADENGNKDFSELIRLAATCPAPMPIENRSSTGLGEEEISKIGSGRENDYVMTGFAQNSVLSAATTLIELIKAGQITKFVVMAGCDGRSPDRRYYADFAAKLPKETVILTAGCAKYRYNRLDLGNIGNTDLPRVLDAGQCNDCYSLAIIALELVRVFGVKHINDLPLEFNIAWYEQKAVLVLLVLLHLGIKNIILGPTLPAFLSPNVAALLVENFNISGNSTVEEDMKKVMA